MTVEAATSPRSGIAPHAPEAEVDVSAYLESSRALALEEIRALVPRNPRLRPILYDLMLEYPLRGSKALRPALCIATCRALGGSLEAVLPSAAVVELYHNAFLIHDDIEDGSESRRDRPTLHRTHGMPVAVNVGDAMLALALQPLLDNIRFIGLGKALRVLEVVARMARESAEGQAIELDWIRHNRWDLTDTDYLRMVYKKTSWYSFITPVLLGGIVAGAPAADLSSLRKFAALLGMAFQIQDDVLNLTAEEAVYGKELAGDLWEGKHTLILMHTLRALPPAERSRAISILAKSRPPLERNGARTRRSTSHDAKSSSARRTRFKTDADLEFLRSLVDRHGSIEYAVGVARQYASRAREILERASGLRVSTHRQFLFGLVDFVVSRDR